MVSSELGACEWFVWDIRRSGLIDRGQLDQLVGEYLKRNPRAEPAGLAEHLVGQSILTPFQAERILQGKTQGLVLGPYILSDTIGAGSMGQVYKATSKTDSQSYAVKVLPRRSMWNVRLARRQVRAFGQFSHSTIVPFLDVGTAGGQHYLVWPLVDGETLESRVQRDGKLAPGTAAHLILQVAQGLALAHANGLFHGLIKPSNILIGDDGQPRILDFGIGSLLAENEGESLVDTMSTANTLTSGLDCASPESVMDPTKRTPAGDQYSLGCVLYYCLAGKYPFADGTAVEKMMAHQFKQPTPLCELSPAVHEGLAATIERMMQKAPEGRYAGAEDVVEALQSFAVEPSRRSHANQYGSSDTRRAMGGLAGVSAIPVAVPINASFGGGSATMRSLQNGPQPPTSAGGSHGSRPHQALPVAEVVGDSHHSASPRHTPHLGSPGVSTAEAKAYVMAASAGAGSSTMPNATDGSRSGRVSPTRYVEPPQMRTPFGGFVMIVGLALIVTIGVYVLGKNFLFAE